MRQLNGKFILTLVALLMCAVIMLTYMLHHCSESKKVLREAIRLEVFQELDSMAWVYEVHPSTKYVTGIKRYYKCDIIKKRIEQETNPDQIN